MGDSLTSPDPTGGLQPGLQWPQVQELLRLKEEYLTSHTSRKVELKKQIDALSGRIKAWVNPRGKSEGFDWVVEFAEVFTAESTGATLQGQMAGIVNRVPGQMELAPADAVQGGKGTGFDIVLANPPYVRADAQFKHIDNEEERQVEINKWKVYREKLKKSKIYKTLYEKWDLYIPFLERAYQLLCTNGQMVFIIPDSYNFAKYTEKSHMFFLQKVTIERIDFCSDIPLFSAGVSNTILHYSKTIPLITHEPKRVSRWGDTYDDFDEKFSYLPSESQISIGRQLFRVDGHQNSETEYSSSISLSEICYISKGMVVHADENKYRGEFRLEDLVSKTKDDLHPKKFVEGKDLAKWVIYRHSWLEYGTERAPNRFSRSTFPEMYSVPEKLISMDISGDNPRVVYDSSQFLHNHSAWSFIPWHYLSGIINNSISKKAKYRIQSPGGDREEKEAVSKQFFLKYLLAIMNSEFAKEWLAKNRTSKLHIYPKDWSSLPIPLANSVNQQQLVDLVNKILSEYDKYGFSVPEESAQKMAKWEVEIDLYVAKLYEA